MVFRADACGAPCRGASRSLRRPEWHDFGPSFASEQLTKRHDPAEWENGGHLHGAAWHVRGGAASGPKRRTYWITCKQP